MIDFGVCTMGDYNHIIGHTSSYSDPECIKKGWFESRERRELFEFY